MSVNYIPELLQKETTNPQDNLGKSDHEANADTSRNQLGLSVQAESLSIQCAGDIDEDKSSVVGAIGGSTASLSFPKDGISLSYMNEFIGICGGRPQLEGLTTTEINERFVKPMTISYHSSLCDMLKVQGHVAVGVALVFISHAWKYLFLDVVDALMYHFRDTPSTIIWFDLFSNNQHKAVDLDFHWWSTTFKSAIQQFGYTVMVFAPWHDPIPLTRGWCLFELYCTIVTRSKFEVAMSDRYFPPLFTEELLVFA